ncbi:hypothetical protein ACFSTC_13110 [Nonomuraea ferruginea]
MRLIALGGEYHATHDSFLGLGCVDAVEAVSTDVVVVSTSAISEKYAFHQEQEIVLVKRAMLGSGTRRILAVDGSKLARVALHRVAPLDDFHVVVVDANAPRRPAPTAPRPPRARRGGAVVTPKLLFVT